MHEYNIINRDIHKEVCVKNNKFYTFLLEDGFSQIIDYVHLHREPLISEDSSLEFGPEKETIEITTIDELRRIFEELVSEVTELMRHYVLNVFGKDPPFDAEPHYSEPIDCFNINDEDGKLLVNQLMIDILNDKHNSDSKMTLHEYCEKHFYVSLQGEWKKIDELEITEHGNAFYTKDAAYKMMKRRIKHYAKIMSKPAKKKQLTARGIDINIYIEFITKKNEKIPKWIWDLIYYNETLTALKQYRLDTWIDDEELFMNYANELNEYDKFVEKAFSCEKEDSKDYFHKSMDLFYLESLSRLGFTNKLAERMEKEGILDIAKADFLTEQFYADVDCPIVIEYEGEETLGFLTKRKFYSPLNLIEASWLDRQDYKLNEVKGNPFFSHPLNFIRAHVYELFKYHYNFASDCYDEIANFIRSNYNIWEEFHEKNKIWKDIKDDEPLLTEQRAHITKMQIINNVIFWKFRKRTIQDSLSATNNKDEELQELFGIDKETCGKILSILESEYTKSHASGGRTPKINVFDRLAVTIEYLRYDRTMDSIASDYGVNKNRISEQIIWVLETLSDKAADDNRNCGNADVVENSNE